MGLSSALSGAVEVNGKLLDATDRTTMKFVQLQRSMDALDAATRRAAKGQEGIAATPVIANMRGQADFFAQQANVIRDALRANEAGDLGTFVAKLKAAEALGLGRDDLSAKRAAELEAQAASMRGRADFFRSQGTSTFELAFGQLTDYQKRTLDVQRAQQELLSLIVRRGGNFNMLEAVELLRSLTDDPAGKHKPNVSQKPNVNITIQRIEVQSDDPDRYAFGLVEAFRDAVKNPSAAVRAIREG
jgi:Arc/MetJ-type ribon-helix-helix transcriptional regulator